MESAKKSLEVQAQVRHNAEEFKNAINDLYSWGKEMRQKEQELLRGPTENPEADRLKTIPVRSHIAEQPKQQDNKKLQQKHETSAKTKEVSPPPSAARTTNGQPATPTPVPSSITEKVDLNKEERQQANLLKDAGNKLVKLGEYEKAIEQYTAAIQLFSEDAVFFSNRALCYLKLERYDACIEDCERAIEVDSLAVKAYYRRMQANESLGNNMDALKDCTTVLMIEPKSSEAQRSLERINNRLRNHTTAHGPNFSSLSNSLVDILPIEKPAYKRSNKPLRRIPIADVVGPKYSNNCDGNLKISDEDIDKLFNSNCGPFVEVKKSTSEITITNTAEGNAKLEEINGTAAEPAAGAKATNTKKDNKLARKQLPATSSTTPNTEQNGKESKTTNEETAATLPTADRTLPPAPTSTTQFYSNWKELASAQKYQYLKSIEIPNLCKVLGAGFDSETLTDVLRILRDYYVPNKEPNTAATLLEVSKNNQVSILSLLMSTEERKALTEIINSFKENNSNATAASTISKNFNLR